MTRFEKRDSRSAFAKLGACEGRSMIRRNCIQLAAKHTNVSSSIAARGFFELFFRWSRVGCSASRRSEYWSTHSRSLTDE